MRKLCFYSIFITIFSNFLFATIVSLDSITNAQLMHEYDVYEGQILNYDHRLIVLSQSKIEEFLILDHGQLQQINMIEIKSQRGGYIDENKFYCIVPLYDQQGNQANYEILVFDLNETPMRKIANFSLNLAIYNIQGQKIKTLVNDVYQSGNHTVIWNGQDDYAKPVGSGVYFYRMQTNDYIGVKRMVLLK